MNNVSTQEIPISSTAHTHAHTHTGTHTRTHTHTQACPHTHIHAHTNTHTGRLVPMHTIKSRSFIGNILSFHTEPGTDNELRISTVKTQEILQGKVVRESAECHGTVE